MEIGKAQISKRHMEQERTELLNLYLCIGMSKYDYSGVV